MTFSGLVLGCLAMVGAVATAFFLLFLGHGILERRKARKEYLAALARFEKRPRATILAVGGVVVDALGREHAMNCTLDCRGEVPAQSIGIHGEILVGGYTREELVEIAKRWKEFQP